MARSSVATSGGDALLASIASLWSVPDNRVEQPQPSLQLDAGMTAMCGCAAYMAARGDHSTGQSLPIIVDRHGHHRSRGTPRQCLHRGGQVAGT